MSSLESQFQNAAQQVKNLSQKPSNEELLNLYGLFKQSTIGNNNTPKPGLFDLKGKAKSLNIDASGGSDVSASDFIVEDCKLEASGGSDAEVYASNSIIIDASSASDVYYYGSPQQRDINASSSADVHKR